MLQFLEQMYQANVRYGFQAPIYVPDVGPVTSLSAQLGHRCLITICDPVRFYVSLLVANPVGAMKENS